jgi:hypothetical protein
MEPRHSRGTCFALGNVGANACSGVRAGGDPYARITYWGSGKRWAGRA